jgi:ATP-dependent Clp protease ATP-binding subunit ClpC
LEKRRQQISYLMTKGKKTPMNNIPLFDKFTERAKKVLNLAEEEARHFQHNVMGTEHLLLGLIREGESVAAHVLESLDVTFEQVRKAVEEAKGRGNAVVQGEIMLSPHMNMAIEMAMKEAERQFPSRSTGAEMPLMGSIQMPESEAVKILQDAKLPAYLESLGVTLEQVRKAVDDAKGRGVQILTDQRSAANTPVEEAERRRHPFFHINIEHLLLGMLRVPESTGVKILQDLGLPSFKDVRTLVYLERSATLPITAQEYSQKFTEQARKAWSRAHEEARRLQDNFVGGHHLLLGLVGEGSGVAATVLAEMGVSLEKMREKVEPGYEAGDWSVPSNIKLQPKLKHIIELASNEARRRYHPAISTGHLLLVMVRAREGRGIETGLLESLGVDLENLRAVLQRTLTEKAGIFEQEIESVTNEIGEEGIYASNAAIASIERDLQSRELDKTLLAVYPFTIEARRVLEDARLTASNLAQKVGPEHLLVGLASLTFGHNGPVSKALGDLGIDFARVRAAVENRAAGGVKSSSVVLVQSALCRACLLFAADEAEQRDGQGAPIKSEHILLGLLREQKGIIAELLSDLGTSVEAVHTKILESLRDAGASRN